MRKQHLYSSGSACMTQQNNPTPEYVVSGTECYDSWVWVIYWNTLRLVWEPACSLWLTHCIWNRNQFILHPWTKKQHGFVNHPGHLWPSRLHWVCLSPYNVKGALCNLGPAGRGSVWRSLHLWHHPDSTQIASTYQPRPASISLLVRCTYLCSQYTGCHGYQIKLLA